MDKTRLIKTILVGLVLITVSAVFYYSRQIFYFQYEPEYFDNLYYHSQWNIPNSTRKIGDGTLYKFVGYRLVEGENPFNLNFEIPPFGKYLYGASSMVIGNPYWISIFLYLISIGVLFYFSKKLFNNKVLAWLSLLLFVTTPFVATQVRETMLDLPMMTMYLIHTLLFVSFLDDQRYKYLIGSGIFLGLATGVKPGIYTPFIGLLGVILIFILRKNWFTKTFLYTYSVFSGYVLSFFSYFIRHPNPIPWVRLHRYLIGFHLSSEISADYLNQWRGIFLNVYQGWWQPGQTIAFGDWSPLIPIGVSVAILFFVWSIFKLEKKWLYISGVVIIFLGINTVIPFWPRYLMPIIPLIILMTTKLFSKIKWIIFILVLLNLPFLKSSIVKFDPTSNIYALDRFFSTKAYRELYRSIDFDQRANLPEEEFIENLEDFFSTLGVRKIDFDIVDISYTTNEANLVAEINYLTKYGEVGETRKFNYFRTKNQWKLDWTWDYLWSGYDPDVGLEIVEDTIPFYQLITHQRDILAERGQWKMVYIIPRLMFNWTEQLNQLAEVTWFTSMEVDKQVRRFIPDEFPRFVGYLDPDLGDKGIEMASEIKGVVLVDIDYPVIPETSKNPQWAAKEIKRLSVEKPELFYVRTIDGHINFPQLPEGDIVVSAK